MSSPPTAAPPRASSNLKRLSGSSPAVLDGHANIRSIDAEYRFTITEHDADRPWMVLGSEQRTVKLPDGRDFFAWAHEQWPAPRWSIEVDPWQMTPAWTP
jgi:hypothetical protein